jgi:hypothetical protein
MQHFDGDLFNLKIIMKVEGKEEYQAKISSRFAVLEK